jgi:multiple antibiotic resistance protein
MQSWQEIFILTFVPLFIVVDAFGNVPFVIALSEGSNPHQRRRIIDISILTAIVVGLIFLFFGQLILKVLGISVGSFAIAGGIVLLVLSIRFTTTGQIVEIVKSEMVAVVPIGTPLTAGPATITTLLLLATQYPIYMVLISYMLNMLVTWTVFMLGNQITRFLGKGGLRAISRVFSLLLAAIAVTMILRGLNLLNIIPTAG